MLPLWMVVRVVMVGGGGGSADAPDEVGGGDCLIWREDMGGVEGGME